MKNIEATSNKSINSRFLFLFFLSGTCALIYEIVWMRMLIPVFGNTVFATSTILSSYMAGLSLGSFFFGRYIDKRIDILKVFAFIEAGIGLFALILPMLLLGIEYIYGNLFKAITPGFYLSAIIKFILCFSLLIIPSFLIGGTLPVASKYFIRKQKSSGKNMGILYYVNTAGAAIGCLLAGFLLIPGIGIRATTYTAVAINIAIAIGFILLNKRALRTEKDYIARVNNQWEERTVLYPKKIIPLVIGAFALSGFIALAYEVYWTRIFTFFTENSTWAFSIILTVILGGIALGSRLFSTLADKPRRQLTILGIIQCGIGLSGIISLFIFARLDYILYRIDTILGNGLLPFIGARFLGCATIVLLPAILMGGMFPIVSRICISKKKSLGKIIGGIYSINTLGAIAGSFVAGFILIPAVGVQKGIIIVGTSGIFMGTFLIILDLAVSKKAKIAFLSVLLAIITGIVLMIPSGIVRSIYKNKEFAQNIVYHNEGIYGTVTVYQRNKPDPFKVLMINGIGEVPTDYSSMRGFRALGYLPYLFNPGASKALVLSFGGGITSGSIAQLNTIKEVDCIEICKDVINASKLFGEENHNVLDNPKINLIIDDGRNYLLKSKVKYDIITADATHPANGDSWVLYTRKFYELCKKQLNPGGIMCQWVPVHGLSAREYMSVINTFQDVFPHITLWYTGSYWSPFENRLFGHTIVVGSQKALNIDYNTVKEIFNNPIIANDLKKMDIVDMPSFLGCFVAGGKGLKEMVGESFVNTDNHMQIGLSKRNINYTRKSATKLLKDFLNHRHSIDYLIETEDAGIMGNIDKQFQATHYTITGDICYVEGMFDLLKKVGADDKQTDYNEIYTRCSYTKKKLSNAVAEYRKALEIVPEDKYTKRLYENAIENLKYSCLALSMTCRKMGNHEKAKHFYNEAQSIK